MHQATGRSHDDIVKNLIGTCHDIIRHADDIVGDISFVNNITVTIEFNPAELVTYKAEKTRIATFEDL